MKDKNVVLEKAGKGKWRTGVKDWKMQDFCIVENSRTENANKEKAGNGNYQHENEGMLITFYNFNYKM